MLEIKPTPPAFFRRQKVLYGKIREFLMPKFRELAFERNLLAAPQIIAWIGNFLRTANDSWDEDTLRLLFLEMQRLSLARHIPLHPEELQTIANNMRQIGYRLQYEVQQEAQTLRNSRVSSSSSSS